MENMTGWTTSSMTTAGNHSNYEGNVTSDWDTPGLQGKNIYDYPEYQMSLDMYPIHTLIFVISGMIGNTLALCVILRKNMRNMSSSVFLAALTLADNLTLLGFLLGMVSLIYTRHIIDKGFCIVYFYFSGLGSMISAWTVVAMSFERVLIVTFPLKAPNWTSRKKAIIAEIIITVALVLHNSHFFWTTNKNEGKVMCDNDHDFYHDFLRGWSIYDAIMSSYLPLVLIFIMNLAIIFQIKKARIVQRAMSRSGKTTEKQSRGSGNSSNATTQITIMSLSVSVAFFICMCPYGIFQIYINHIVDFNNIGMREYSRLALTNQVCLILWEINHSINVVLYTVTGNKYRKEMLSFLTCGKYKGGSRQLSTNLSSYRRSTGRKASDDVTTECKDNEAFTQA